MYLVEKGHVGEQPADGTYTLKMMVSFKFLSFV